MREILVSRKKWLRELLVSKKSWSGELLVSSKRLMREILVCNETKIGELLVSKKTRIGELLGSNNSKIPDWLEGRFFRLGPARWDFEGLTLNHWLDGCALLYKFTLRNGQVEIMSRFLDSDSYKKITTVNRPVYTEFGTKSYPDPCKNVFSRYFSQLVPLDMTDNAIGNIFPLDDDIYCASETCYVWKINPDTLQGKEKVDLKSYVSINVAGSHPHRCPDGCVYNLGASFMTGMKYHIFKLSPMSATEEKKNKGRKGFERASVLCSINSNWKTNFSYYHSFGLTEHHVLFLEQPLLINTIKMAASGVQGHAIKECFEWHPKEKTRFHLVNRVSGKHQKIRYQSEAFFTLHHVNTYEDDGHLVADIMAFESPDVLDKFYLKKLRMGEFDLTCQPQLHRFVLPLKTDGNKGENLVKLKYTRATAVKQDNGVIFLTPEPIGERGFELPTINYPMCNTRKYKYVYGSGVFETGKFKNSIVKLDTTNERTLVWKEKDTMYPGEAVFVSSPGAVEEDDGVLLTVVLDVDPDSPDFLLILDAKDLKEIARADVPANIRLPAAIHGLFLKD